MESSIKPQVYIKIIKSNDMWDEDCDGWYDLYKVDGHFIYPLSDWWENDPVPQDILSKFKETLNGSKIQYGDMVKSLYWDLLLTSNDITVDFDEWCEDNWGQCTNWMEGRLRDKLGVFIEVVGHDVAYSDMLTVQGGESDCSRFIREQVLGFGEK